MILARLQWKFRRLFCYKLLLHHGMHLPHPARERQLCRVASVLLLRMPSFEMVFRACGLLFSAYIHRGFGAGLLRITQWIS